MTAAGAGAHTDTAAHPGTPETDRPWRRALRAAGALWAVSHVGYAALFTIAFWSGRGAPAMRNVLAPWDRWDSNWFTLLAVRGYREPDTAAFFPLYPMLVRAVDAPLPGGALPAALAVSNAAALGALAVLYRLVERDFGRPLADRTTWYLIAFPTAFFLSVGYNESLFLLLSASCLYLLRGGRWLAAGLLGGLAAATRSVGVLLLVPFCYEYIRQRGHRLRTDALSAVMVPAGLVAFMVFTQVRFGDALAFAHAQRHWGRRVDWPWTGFVATFRNLAHARPLLAPDGAHLILDLVTAALVITLLTLAFVGPWRMRRDQWALPLYGVVLTLAIISFPSFRAESQFPLMSAPRLALEVIPAFVVAARIGGNRAAERLYLFVALVMQGGAVAQYLNGAWVA